MSRSSHLFVSILFCLLFIASLFPRSTSSQSTLRSLSLNGTTSSVDVPYNSTLNIIGPITIEAWIKVNAIDGNYHDIISRIDRNTVGSGGGYSITVTNLGKLRLDLFQANNAWTSVIGTTTISATAWHHVAGVFDGSQMRVYLDGVLNGSLNTTNGPASGTGVLRIGKAGHTAGAPPGYLPSYAFAGLIDEARVSAAALYTSNFTPGLGPGTNVRGLWKFDGQTTNDFSGNGNNGTLQNGATYSTDVPATGGPQRPVAVAGGPYSGQLGQAVQFSSSGSFDPDGTIASYYWNFGDSSSSSTANPTHTYGAPGLYTATLTVTDNSGLRTSATAAVTISGTDNSRLDPLNQTGGSGENPLSRNFNWILPLVSLPGRAGLDLNLSLSYNSLVWTKSGSYISFDDDHGFPSPGFHLGFPVIEPYFNTVLNQNGYILLAPDGSRVELRRVPTATTLYQAVDSSYLLLDSTTMTLKSADGTQALYAFQGSDLQCTQVKDRNGNYITINYTSAGHVDTIVDTLGRTVKFNYDASASLTSITQTWTVNGSAVTHTWASFEYLNPNLTINTNFTGLTTVGAQNGSSRKVLSRVTLADDSRFEFDYTSWGQVWKIRALANDVAHTLLNYQSYDLPLDNTTVQSDCPRFTVRRDWAKYWNRDTNGLEQEAVTSFMAPANTNFTMPEPGSTSQPGTVVQVTLPDGTFHKIYSHSSGWDKGLPLLTETYDNSQTRQRQVSNAWTQDDTGLTVPLNPRVIENNIYDPAGNRKHTSIIYQQITLGDTTVWSFPQDEIEYQADAGIVLRSTRTTYNTNSAYTDRRILGLVSQRALYEGDVRSGGVLSSKFSYQYDETGSIQGADAPIQHDTLGYTVGRANLSSVSRYDINNASQPTTTSNKYNTAGAIISTTDPSNHTAQLSYADSFSDGVSRNTLAFPTTLTDPDGYTTTTKYNFDSGAVTYRRTPQPNTTSNLPGPEQTLTYDSIGRLDRSTNLVNNAYVRYVYGPNYVETWSTVNTVADEAHTVQIVDGAGRVIATAKNHPGSIGGFSGQLTVYDNLGRAIKQSNPTETSVNITSAPINPYGWAPAGDDAAAGWIYTQQTYDWKGRPRVTTNQDGTTKTASYTGCGCAGGEVVTLTDEGTIDAGVAKRRQQKVYADVLGRTVKTEVLNWEGGTVYSTTVNTYNVRDQIKTTTQYAGAQGSGGASQVTTSTFDGYGRLQTRHVPEQDPGTVSTWTYNADDTVNTVTDARGAVSTYSYTGTNRHLVKQVTHTLTGSPTVTNSFTYDSVGNRLSMNDGAGSTAYSYNQLAQLTSETRTIPNVGSFTLTYSYNLSGELSGITDPFAAAVGYTFDNIGRITGVMSSNYVLASYATNFQYRATDALKSLTYSNSKTLTVGYNSNLQVSTFEIPGLLKKSYQYYDDGQLKFTQDQLQTNSKFDRAYQYDHVGRQTKALTGQEARGGAATDDRPYNETMAFDTMGHLVQRDIRNWDRGDSMGNPTYTNNRHAGWSYDADGRLTMGNGFYYYDAAGQISSFDDGGQFKTDQQVDGDGRRVRSEQKTFDPNTAQWVSGEVKYYIRSSVLGQVLTEVSNLGAKQRTFVYMGGKILAIQVIDANQEIVWEHYDPSDGSYRETDTNGNSINAAEMDPMGADAGLMKPITWPDPSSTGKLEPYYTVPDLNSTTQGCQSNGVQMPCDQQLQMSFWGSAVANLPGFGTDWGSFSQLDEWEYELNLAYTLARLKGVQRRLEGDPRERGQLPQNPTQVGGQRATFGPPAVFDPTKLSGCVDSLFHVSGDFHGDRSGGSFLGSENGKLFEVDFNTSSYTLSSLRRETKRADAIGFSERGGGWTVFIASDFAKNPATLSVVVTAVEIHELGNKLAEVFIRNPRLFPKAKSNWLRRFDSDAGMALEECVFGGGVSTNTGRVTTNP